MALPYPLPLAHTRNTSPSRPHPRHGTRASEGGGSDSIDPFLYTSQESNFRVPPVPFLYAGQESNFRVPLFHFCLRVQNRLCRFLVLYVQPSRYKRAPLIGGSCLLVVLCTRRCVSRSPCRCQGQRERRLQWPPLHSSHIPSLPLQPAHQIPMPA